MTVHVNESTEAQAAIGSVAVLIAAYQASGTLARAIRSALDQTYAPTQVIVVDDGSTDGTWEVAQEFAAAGVLVVRQTNKGVSAARNRGLREVSAEFVSFLDADDWWATDKLAIQVTALTAHPHKIATYTGVTEVDAEDGSERGRPPTDESTLWPRLRWVNPSIPPSSVMMRTQYLRSVGGFREDLEGGEDWALWIQIKRNDGFTTTPEPVTFYLLSSSGLSGDAQKMYDSFLKLLDGALLEGLTGWQRAWWRRRLIGFQAYKAALTARAKGEWGKEWQFMQRSFLAWPSPFWPEQRLRSALVTLLRRH